MGQPRYASATEIGYLRGGERAAVRTGLAMLHARGLLVSDRAGAVTRTGVLPPVAEPLERALYVNLHGAMAPREVASQRRVRRALDDLREGLVGLGLIRPPWRRFLFPAVLLTALPLLLARLVSDDLLSGRAGLTLIVALAGAVGWFLPHRTLAGGRALRATRGWFAATGGPPAAAADRIGLAVALYGSAALVATMPRFARAAGLLDGRRWARLLGDPPRRGRPVSLDPHGVP